MDGDWNPFFTRKKKRNRVSRGAPTRPRRYFFWPCVLLVGLTLLVRLGVVGQLITLARLDTVTIHVSFNSLNPNSKWRSPDGRFLLGGVKLQSTDIYECEVPQGLWERVSENTHVSIPSKQCRAIDPAVPVFGSVTGSLPLSHGGYSTLSNETGGGVVVFDGQTVQQPGAILRTPATSSWDEPAVSGVATMDINRPVVMTPAQAEGLARVLAPSNCSVEPLVKFKGKTKVSGEVRWTYRVTCGP